ncbi:MULTISPECIES: divergent polysaccharide deacetylase family protein [Arsenophonus]|uniref:divergent polysaccharide deacetylase family protein n=1 Tax=Arsenophonus TaxID=637 RepID=UPI001CDCD1AD|nr:MULTISPECIES: divergent polysaccharide deacetylase family protein [Arsenophonus]UBX29228.1 divergent polysaccharide deacetylase family protein [Arsenophonus apicola]
MLKRIVLIIMALMLLVSGQVNAGKLAIVIDDIGYRKKEDNQILALPVAISIAILPDSPYGREMAEKANQQGREILIHMPMKPISQQPLEKNTLTPQMSANEIEQKIVAAIKQVPYAKGMNNHMGSAMMANLVAMKNVMQVLSHYDLYFLDSVTTANTKVNEAAKIFALPTMRRNVFLDHLKTETQIRKQFAHAISLARKQGSSIVIGHPYPATIQVLQQTLFELPSDIELVAVGKLLNNTIKDKLTIQTVGQDQEKVPAQPVELQKAVIGYCKISPVTKALSGIDLMIYIVDAIYHDPDLKKLFTEQRKPLFSKNISLSQ